MLYKRIQVELIVVADEAGAVVAESHPFWGWDRDRCFRAHGNPETLGTRAYDGRRGEGRSCCQSCA
jgi:hypothetical protein